MLSKHRGETEKAGEDGGDAGQNGAHRRAMAARGRRCPAYRVDRRAGIALTNEDGPLVFVDHGVFLQLDGSSRSADALPTGGDFARFAPGRRSRRTRFLGLQRVGFVRLVESPAGDKGRFRAIWRIALRPGVALPVGRRRREIRFVFIVVDRIRQALRRLWHRGSGRVALGRTGRHRFHAATAAAEGQLQVPVVADRAGAAPPRAFTARKDVVAAGALEDRPRVAQAGIGYPVLGPATRTLNGHDISSILSAATSPFAGPGSAGRSRARGGT